MAELQIADITSGSMDGKTVWICHYNRPDMNKKPLRCIPPTKCIVVSNEATMKKIYYSSSHFAKVKIYAPFDNTGFRSYSGNPVHVFTDELQCVESWREQVAKHVAELDILIENATKHWQTEKNTLMAMA